MEMQQMRELGRELAGSLAARERAGCPDGAVMRRIGAAGLLGAVFPRSYGGAGCTAQALCEAVIELGESAGDAGLALAWAAHTLACGAPIWRLGSEAQRRRYLPELAAGRRVGAWAHDERALVGDPVGVQARALRRGSGWVLTGRKTWVVNAPIADIFVVTACTEAGRGAAGVSSFIVERGMPGLMVGPRIATAGVPTAAIADVVFEHCELGPERLLGAEGGGLSRTCQVVRRWERGLGLAPWVGLVRGALAHSLAHAQDFVRVGARLAESQALRARLADMRIRVALCEHMQGRSAWQLDHAGAGSARELAVGRLFLGEAVAAIVREAASVCAPQALELGHPVGRLVRDVGFAGRLGVEADVLRSIIAGSMLGLG